MGGPCEMEEKVSTDVLFEFKAQNHVTPLHLNASFSQCRWDVNYRTVVGC